ncbi:MAG TPA: transcriptional repressor [Candidatus Paceibacterota bacterium]|nr:transcriptional repressor [Candidatus Paceibacterota bacterium]
MKREEIRTLLRKEGYKATEGRIALISELAKKKEPQTILSLSKRLKGVFDETNIYRALESFITSGFVRKIDFQKSHGYYELTLGEHHHHLVCTECGKVEDVDVCADKLEKKALKGAKSFSNIKDHSLEFFGVCKTCLR